MKYEEFYLLLPHEQLDFILTHLNNDKLPESIEEIEDSLMWNPFDEKIDKTINLILHKLIKDEYVNKVHREEIKRPIPRPAGQTYYISFEGKLFIENGGYNQQQKESNRHKTIEITHQWVLSIGTLLAGLYGLVEISKWIYRHFYH
jgi:hypothetical protein